MQEIIGHSDERGNKITEEFTRLEIWATITTFTWNNVIEDASSSPVRFFRRRFDIELMVDFAADNPDFSYRIPSCEKVDAVRTLTDIDTDKIIKEIFGRIDLQTK